MMNAKIFLFVLSMFILKVSLFSQEKCSLERRINYTIEHSIQIKQQEWTTQLNENTFLQTKLDAIPSLNAGASHGFSFGRALDESNYEFTQDQEVQSGNFSLSSNFILFNGFNRLNLINKNRFSFKSRLQEFESLNNGISLSVSLAYLQKLFL